MDNVWRIHALHGIYLLLQIQYSPDMGLSRDGVLGAGVDGVVGLGSDTGLGVGGRLTSDRGLTSPLSPTGPFDKRLVGLGDGDGCTSDSRGGRTDGGCNRGGNDKFGGNRGRGWYAGPGGTWPWCCWTFGSGGRGVVGGAPPPAQFAAASLLAAAAAAFLLAFSLLLMMTSLSNCTTWRGGLRPLLLRHYRTIIVVVPVALGDLRIGRGRANRERLHRHTHRTCLSCTTLTIEYHVCQIWHGHNSMKC